VHGNRTHRRKCHIQTTYENCSQAEGAPSGARRAIFAPEAPPGADLRGLLAQAAELLQGAGQADLADLVRLWPALGQEVQQEVLELVWQAVAAPGR